jgi:hypothetical protein
MVTVSVVTITALLMLIVRKALRRSQLQRFPSAEVSVPRLLSPRFPVLCLALSLTFYGGSPFSSSDFTGGRKKATKPDP